MLLWPVVALGYDVPAVARSVSAVVALSYDVPAVARSVSAVMACCGLRL